MSAVRGRLVQRATIERNMTPDADGYGNARPAAWGTLYAALACYYWQPAGGGEQQGERNVRIYTHQMLVPAGTAVTEADRVNGIVDRRGVSVNAAVFNITAVVRKPDHLLLTLEVVY